MSNHLTAPTTVITPTDHGGLITITAAVGLTFALCSMLIRLYARAAINGPWSHDDTALALSTVMCVAQSIAKMVSVTNGLGRAIDLISPAKLIVVEKTDYASDLLYILTIYLSKVSAVCLFLRVTPIKQHIRFCYGILGTSTVWVVVSEFMLALRCQLGQPWVNERCVNIFLRWQLVGAFDVITEFALFAMAVYLVVDLRITLQLKIFVVLAFAFRVPVIAFIIVRLHYLNIQLLSSDPTFNAVLASIWLQVHEDYVIISSTVPCLKPFMIACNTGWGHAAPHTGEGSMVPKSGSYALNSINKSGVLNTLTSFPQPDRSDQRPLHRGQGEVITVVGGVSRRVNDHQSDPNPDETSHSIASNDSQQMIIRREVGWTVTYDDETPRENSHSHGNPISHRSDIEAQNTGAIDDVHRAIIPCTDAETRNEGKSIVEDLAKFKYELQHDRKLTPLVDDGKPDIQAYNAELTVLGSPTWFNVPWLYAECYLYRRINTSFAVSKHWKDYDIFARQKMSTFRSSRPAVLELAAKYKELVSQLESDAVSSKSVEEVKEAERILFIEMCEICLWGNATDLSLLTSLTYEDLQKLQGAEARKTSEKNILVNDLPAAYNVLKTAREDQEKQERRIDIVLDNAGFELFVDLILAGYLLSAGLATQIVLHPKSIPWFVSDVVPDDFSALLHALADPQWFYATTSDEEKGTGIEAKASPLMTKEANNLTFLFYHWSRFHQDGKLIIRPDLFWTSASSYWRIPRHLHEDLSQSELVIFKGDLNYRKLTGDAKWSPTTSFSTAIGPLGPKSGVRTLALRTCKADVVVGLPEGEDERLRAVEGGGGDTGARKWAWSGKWAVVQFCDGKA
ncbi:hypothetical protein MMC07_007846 [Pseudocyphellaria aurata]|nr:hypothetical protein [Pseudocyphellaria aurata]